MVTPLVKNKIVKKRLKPFLRNQSDGKLAMGVRGAPAAPNGPRRRRVLASRCTAPVAGASREAPRAPTGALAPRPRCACGSAGPLLALGTHRSGQHSGFRDAGPAPHGAAVATPAPRQRVRGLAAARAAERHAAPPALADGSAAPTP